MSYGGTNGNALSFMANHPVLKSWILPAGNDFIKDPAGRHVRPEGNPGEDFPFVLSDFCNSSWERVNLVPFPSHQRKAFSGLALVIVRVKPGESGSKAVKAKSPGLQDAQVVVKSQNQQTCQ